MRSTIDEVLMKPMVDEETSLVECTFENDAQISEVIRNIAIYNRRYDQVI